MSQLTYRTSQCGRYGHPEFTLIFSKQQPVPVERMLLGYFENGVARGAKFLPGQVVQLGWAALRLMKRQDGTIGVQEIETQNESGWVESVDKSLMQTWFQKEVVASLSIEEPAFPRQVQNAIVCKKLLDGGPEFLLRAVGHATPRIRAGSWAASRRIMTTRTPITSRSRNSWVLLPACRSLLSFSHFPSVRTFTSPARGEFARRSSWTVRSAFQFPAPILRG